MDNNNNMKTAGHNQSPASIRRVAICGEIRSGKSSILNALMSESFLPDNLGNDERPTVFVEYEGEKDVAYFTADGVSVAESTLKTAKIAPKIENIQVSHDREELATFEFIEIPLSNAESLTEKQIRFLQTCDIMVWSTIASQAWRLTEKTIIEAFGDALPKYCILSVSRSDKLRNLTDKNKLSDRLERETSDIFGEIVFAKNSRQKIAMSTKSEIGMRKTGADEILDALNKMSEKIDQDQITAKAAIEAGPDLIVEHLSTDSKKKHPSDKTIEKTLKRQIDDIGQNIVVGVHLKQQVDGLKVIKGNLDFGQRVGQTCRQLQSTWLDAGGRDLEDEETKFSISVRTENHSLFYQNATDAAALFMFSNVADQNHGVAQSKLTQMCKSLAAAD